MILPITDPALQAGERSGYRSYNLNNFKELPFARHLDREQLFAIEVVSKVLPFRANNYVVEELIDWGRVPDDAVFKMIFPQQDMLEPEHFQRIAALLSCGANEERIRAEAERIREELHPLPAGQARNRPILGDQVLQGMQHKYRETVLFFPSQAQTCHAFCTFCFRWSQFVGREEQRFAMREGELLVEYLRGHPDVSDVLITGGDPMIMKAGTLASYLDLLLEADLPNLNTIRLGTKSLSYWPYRFLSDPDSEDLLALFRRVTRSGRHLALMAHFNHPQELRTLALRQAVERIQSTGAQIRTQSPLLAQINDQPRIWEELWREQVRLGCVPYYMFVERNTGAQRYFKVPLVRAWEIFGGAYRRVSGIARTVRGPSMSADPGKVQVLGVSEIGGERVIALQFLQGRDPEWVARPFFARYSETAAWLDELEPAFGEECFFFEQSMRPLAEVEHEFPLFSPRVD